MDYRSDKATVDPVCGMSVDVISSDHEITYKGRSYHFCAEQCKKAFEKNPGKYTKPKGRFGRFLERLAKTNEKTFGKGGPSCCH
jgi:YHS domain-containing protein